MRYASDWSDRRACGDRGRIAVSGSWLIDLSHGQGLAIAIEDRTLEVRIGDRVKTVSACRLDRRLRESGSEVGIAREAGEGRGKAIDLALAAAEHQAGLVVLDVGRVLRQVRDHGRQPAGHRLERGDGGGLPLGGDRRVAVDRGT